LGRDAGPVLILENRLNGPSYSKTLRSVHPRKSDDGNFSKDFQDLKGSQAINPSIVWSRTFRLEIREKTVNGFRFFCGENLSEQCVSRDQPDESFPHPQNPELKA